MNPTACYLDMFTAMNDGDWETARRLGLSLRDWLETGGLYPPGYDKDEVREYLKFVLRRTRQIA